MSAILSNSEKAFLVVGATSNIGAGVAKGLKKTGSNVTALVRSEEKGKPFKDEGINIAVGDLSEPATLASAFKGIDASFILTPPNDLAPSLFSNAIWAAKQAGVKHVVRLSAVKAAHDAPTINSRFHALSDSELIASGTTYTIIKAHFFMQNLLMAADTIKSEGKIYMPLSDGKLGLIDSRDIATFAVKVLTEQGHENKTYTITGPESLSMKEVASSLSKVVGKNVEYVPVPIDVAIENMRQAGLDNFTLNILHDYFVQYSKNWGDFVTSDYKDVVGTDSTSIEKYFEDNKQVFE
ncbi:LAQU0S10e01904g1_1 [Lachancea quebecensis]|uniref:LAQU0S10e01904g1_1 n=1 Tax=Lachancea quebecensis TaxID=1654605 RepID=A0A0P1KUB5_9SACH|nr:LAQU0S10e01904g1_1 [Lachancea quebecensis]